MPLPRTGKTTTAVITGGHAFDVPGFHDLFRSLPEVDAYIQPMEDFVADTGRVREQYDVLVFYNMHRDVPPDGATGYEGRLRNALEGLRDTGQGILVLHHAILAYIGWPLWADLVGIGDRTLTSFHHGANLGIQVADADHPITRGLESWEIVDETYVMNDPESPDGNRILLTVDHPQSMCHIGWTRSFGRSRIFCYELGHDDGAYTNPGFQTVLSRGIEWCAGRI